MTKLNDLRHGYGVYAWPSGDRYAGEWADDAITGMPTPMMIARAQAKTRAQGRKQRRSWRWQSSPPPWVN